MTILANLPSEIILAICSQLCTHCLFGPLDLDPSDEANLKAGLRKGLSSLSRTCKRLRDCAQPVLFHSLGHNEDRFASLLRTLHRHQRLAKEVVHLRIMLASPLSNENISAEDSDLFNRLMEKHNPQSLERPTGGLLQHSPSAALAALVLTQVPNLVRLHVSTLFHFEFPFCQSGSLSFLTELSILHKQERFNVNSLEDILAAAPVLQALTCTGIYGHLSKDFPSCGLTSLALLKSSITKDSLKAILSTCHNLKSFAHENTGYDSTFQPTPHDISLALIQRSGSLQKLRIYRRYVFSRDGVADGVRSLKKMKSLKALEIHSTALWSIRDTDSTSDGNRLTKLLPSSIQSFAMTDPHEAFLPDIVKLAENASTRFPQLRKVHFGVIDENIWDIVGTAFTSRGIECKSKQVIPAMSLS